MVAGIRWRAVRQPGGKPSDLKLSDACSGLGDGVWLTEQARACLPTTSWGISALRAPGA